MGRGWYGNVWLVDYKKRVPVTNETPDGWSQEMRAAAKIMRLREADQEDGEDVTKCVKYLLIEMRALHRLTNFNKNMVHLLDVICVPDSRTHFPFSSVLMLMEACHGDLINLHHLSGDFISHMVCRKWMRNITNALLYMHSRNAVHLDIKPDNIMFQRVKNQPQLTKDVLMSEYPTMTFKLGDFGFCEIYDSDQTSITTQNAGTEDYQSPELKQRQLRIAGIRSKPCDIYSLGMTLASCLMPVKGFDYMLKKGIMQQRIAKIVSGELSDPNHNITPEVAYVLYDMLHTDPSMRLTIDQLSKKLWLTGGVSKKTLPSKNKRGRYQWFPKSNKNRELFERTYIDILQSGYRKNICMLNPSSLVLVQTEFNSKSL